MYENDENTCAILCIVMEEKMKIAVFVGSLREDSLNKKLARSLEELSPDNVEFEYVNINVPLLNQDIKELPEEVREMRSVVEDADAVLFVTPEYNRGVPGVLKNAIDWCSHPGNTFREKPAGIVGATISPYGTAVAQSTLRHTVGYLGMHLMGQPELYFNLADSKFEENSKVKPEYKEKLQNYIDKFVSHVGKFS